MCHNAAPILICIHVSIYAEAFALTLTASVLKFGSLPEIIKMLRSTPLLKPYVKLHLSELDNL